MELNYEKLKELNDSGLTNKEMSVIFNVSIATIKRNKSKYGIKTRINEVKKENIKCLNCENEFETLKTENRKFCCSSCSAKYNNKRKVKREKIKNDDNGNKKRIRIRKEKNYGICLNCKCDIIKSDGRSKSVKYCSLKCQAVYQMNLRVDSGRASTNTLKRYLIHNHGNKCMECEWAEVNPTTGKVPIELEHIDGNSENNSLENLKLLCPNCHSLTPTYKALNKGNGRHKRMERYKDGKSF